MSDQYTFKQMQEMLPMILASVIQFLNTMESSDYLTYVMDVLFHFAENYQSLFAARFNVNNNRFVLVFILTPFRKSLI
jgi:hypothetical protein